jgi:hypothetical protein
MCPSQATAGGFVQLNTLANYVQQAFSTESLSSWCQNGGCMIYYFLTTSLPSSS